MNVSLKMVVDFGIDFNENLVQWKKLCQVKNVTYKDRIQFLMLKDLKEEQEKGLLNEEEIN